MARAALEREPASAACSTHRSITLQVPSLGTARRIAATFRRKAARIGRAQTRGELESDGQWQTAEAQRGAGFLAQLLR
jgi:hypothetical protein